MIHGPTYIGYLTLGDGGLDYSLASALALVKGGVDLLEIGIPFSDPVADGPVIQKAMERALENGTTPHDLIPFLKAFRQHSDIPVVLFSYYNPILAAGKEFLDQAKQAGANGMLIVDLPFELMPESSLDPILIVSTSTPDARLKQIVQKGRGFIYYACQKGTTGMRSGLPTHVPHDIARIKAATTLPVAIGFGISNKDTAQEALQHADAFVVGSYIVDAMSRKVTPEELTQLVAKIDPRIRSQL
ncbi:MAG: tryptophan synthase subunit alpha [Candidatus Melainabacteria bacterium]|nr:tryptophan synthase subunit alpha [Candidatus Melainabacteria bacterium]